MTLILAGAVELYDACIRRYRKGRFEFTCAPPSPRADGPRTPPPRARAPHSTQRQQQAEEWANDDNTSSKCN